MAGPPPDLTIDRHLEDTNENNNNIQSQHIDHAHHKSKILSPSAPFPSFQNTSNRSPLSTVTAVSGIPVSKHNLFTSSTPRSRYKQPSPASGTSSTTAVAPSSPCWTPASRTVSSGPSQGIGPSGWRKGENSIFSFGLPRSGPSISTFTVSQASNALPAAASSTSSIKRTSKLVPSNPDHEIFPEREEGDHSVKTKSYSKHAIENQQQEQSQACDLLPRTTLPSSSASHPAHPNDSSGAAKLSPHHDSIQRRLHAEIRSPMSATEDRQRLLPPHYDDRPVDSSNSTTTSTTTTTAAAATLVMHALQSPAKIGNGLPREAILTTSIFPPSPDGLSLKEPRPSSKRIMTRARSKSLKSQDENIQQNCTSRPAFKGSAAGLNMLASPTAIPARRRSLKGQHYDRDQVKCQSVPQGSSQMNDSMQAEDARHQTRFDLSDWQYDLAAIASTGPCEVMKTPTSRSFPSSLRDLDERDDSPDAFLESSSSRADRLGLTGRGATAFSPSLKSSLSHQPASSTSASTLSNRLDATLVGNDSTSRAGPVGKQRVAASPARSPLRAQARTSLGQVASSAFFNRDTPSTSAQMGMAMVPFASVSKKGIKHSKPRTAGHSRTHSRGKSTDLKILTYHGSGSKLSSEQGNDSSGDDPVTISNSFDACASAMRHRQRTMSISESEDNETDKEDDLGDASSQADSPSAGLSGSEFQSDCLAPIENQQVHRHHPTSLAKLQIEGQDVDMDVDSVSCDESCPDILNRKALFVEENTRARGASMPSARETRLKIRPLASQLTSSRVSYPPKNMRAIFNDQLLADGKGKGPLHSSVPASGRTVSQPMDELFLASILAGSSSQAQSGGNTESNSHTSLSKSTGSSLDNIAGSLKSSKSLQPVSSTTVSGRKRTVNGLMIASAPHRSTSGEGQESRTIVNTALTIGRPSIDGSTDEDDASPTLPSLTDSSSVTSSLASSQRSGHAAALFASADLDKQVDDSVDSTDLSFDDPSFIAMATVPAEHNNLRPLPRAASTRRDLSEADRVPSNRRNQLASPDTSEFLTGIAKKTSPHFKHIRPLQAAFSNSGLLSKKSIRSRLERDSGIGLSSTPPTYAMHRLIRKDRDNSFKSTPGRLPDLTYGTPGLSDASINSAHIHLGSPVPRVSIAPSGSFTSNSITSTADLSQGARMPDTPCKKPGLYPQARNALPASVAGASQAQLHPLAHSIRPSAERSVSSCSSSFSDSSSVTNSIPGSISKSHHRFSGIAQDRQTSDTVSRSAHKSPAPSITSVATNSPIRGNYLEGSIIVPRRRMGPNLFRRRSSGQIQTGSTGSYIHSPVQCSGNPIAVTPDWEPMTPTRVSAEVDWIPSIHNTQPIQHSPVSARDTMLGVDTIASPISPLEPNPLAFQPLASGSSSSDHSCHSPSGVSLPHITALQRPPFRTRHSSSIVHNARHSELVSPDRFSTCFSISRALGQGEFSEAFEVQDRRNGQAYAIKKTKVPLVGPKARLRRLEEVDILRLLSRGASDSTPVIRLYDAWEQSGNLFIQTELCPFGNLAVFLEDYGRSHEVLEEARVWKICAEITAGIAYIHEHGVLHLDIKPANVFITGDGSLKIGDFGLATRWPRVRSIAIVQGAAVQSPGWDAAAASSVWISERTRSQSVEDTEVSRYAVQDLEREGDREYIAPEILRGQYGKPADMFALGLLVLEAAANVVLPDNGLPWRKLREDDFSDVQMGHLSDELVNVIVNLLQSEPLQRTTVHDLVRHPVIACMQSLKRKGLEKKKVSQLEPAQLSQADRNDIEDRHFDQARGAVIEEAEDFLAKVMAEVRHNWYSPRKVKQYETTQITPMESPISSDQMQIDAWSS